MYHTLVATEKLWVACETFSMIVGVVKREREYGSDVSHPVSDAEGLQALEEHIQ